MKKIIAMAILMIFICTNAWAQPTPTTPPTPESLGITAPSPTSSTAAPPASESSQALMTTTASSAKAAAPSTQSVSATSTYMIVPPGTSAPNKFYIPYSPSTVASCYFGQWVPMWLDVRGYGPLYSYEWYPNGNLVSQYLANVPYPSWQKMWFYGDATGWHTLQYYCNGWSNYVYVYVYAYAGSTPTPPPSSCNAKIVVSSPYAKGFSVYVDGSYQGGDGQNGDPLDGYFTLYVPGNQQHTVKVYYQGGTYQQTKTYYCGSTYTITLSSPPSGSAPPSTPSEPVYPTNPIYYPVYPSNPIAYPPSVSQLPSNPPSVSQLPAPVPSPTPMPAPAPAPSVTPY